MSFIRKSLFMAVLEQYSLQLFSASFLVTWKTSYKEPSKQNYDPRVAVLWVKKTRIESLNLKAITPGWVVGYATTKTIRFEWGCSKKGLNKTLYVIEDGFVVNNFLTIINYLPQFPQVKAVFRDISQSNLK